MINNLATQYSGLTEYWADFPETSRYQISNFGRVKSLCGKEPRIMSLPVNNKGYHTVVVMINKKRRTFKINRLVAQVFIPNPNNLPQVHHINHIKTDNRVCNLQWVSGSTNIREAVKTGRIVGENNGKAKLTAKDVLEIRRLLELKTKRESIAQQFNVGVSTIYKIKARKLWDHI